MKCGTSAESIDVQDEMKKKEGFCELSMQNLREQSKKVEKAFSKCQENFLALEQNLQRNKRVCFYVGEKGLINKGKFEIGM